MSRRPRLPHVANRVCNGQVQRLGGGPEAAQGLQTHYREDQAPDEPWLDVNDGAAQLLVETHHPSSGPCPPGVDVYWRE
jgi:hypothetical protein